MTKTWFIGDLHIGHANIITFKGSDGKLIRPFKTIEEHDETLLENFNKLVSPNDRVYFMGDIAINRKCLPMLAKFNGRKKLIKGNHDIFKLKDYTPYFEDIVAYRTYPEHGLIFSHIPVHPSQLEYRFKRNVHGHLHSNLVQSHGSLDWKYINICPEHTDFKPVDFNQLISLSSGEYFQYPK